MNKLRAISHLRQLRSKEQFSNVKIRQPIRIRKHKSLTRTRHRLKSSLDDEFSMPVVKRQKFYQSQHTQYIQKQIRKRRKQEQAQVFLRKYVYKRSVTEQCQMQHLSGKLKAAYPSIYSSRNTSHESDRSRRNLLRFQCRSTTPVPGHIVPRMTTKHTSVEPNVMDTQDTFDLSPWNNEQE